MKDQEPNPKDQKPNQSGGILKALTVTTTIGAELAIMVTLGFFGGKTLDEKLGTGPWLMVTGILLGVVAGTWGIIVTLEKFWKEGE
ncbi:MAG: AtpZ/AtpI family protein [Firmicutes bacterium]|nr:AtpZ/AtpI family protein [Bacillota bacterium]